MPAVQNQVQSRAVILSRVDYGEADRILTLLTPDHGKIRLIAKGVRRIKSKLAGGIELFSVSDITYIRGKRDIGTLVSTRLITYYDGIVRDIDRTMLGYELIKQMNGVTEDAADEQYFGLLEATFKALNDAAIDADLIRLWFVMQLLRYDGHSPNLHTELNGQKLQTGGQYEFSFDDMTFLARPEGHFTADHIKVLRLGFAGTTPAVMQKVTGLAQLLVDIAPLVQTMGPILPKNLAIYLTIVV